MHHASMLAGLQWHERLGRIGVAPMSLSLALRIHRHLRQASKT